jgi:hypothetical protein
MRRLVTCTILLAGCRHGSVRPSPAAAPPSTILVLQEGGSVVAVDPAAGTAQVVPGLEDLGRLDQRHAVQHGPYVTFSHDDAGQVLDLRLRDYAVGDALRAAIDDAAAISSDPGDTVLVDEAIDVRVAAPSSLPSAPRRIPRPAPEIVTIAISPDGATIAVVAGPDTEGDAPQDLFTIRARDGATERRTTEGDVLDVRFDDDERVVLVRGSDDAFEVLELGTGRIERIAPPAGWSPALFDEDTAPLLPLTNDQQESRRALLEARSGQLLELAYGDQLVAVAPDGGSVLVTQDCAVPAGLTRRFLGGAVEELRAPVPREACATEEPPLHVSAAFSADGRYVVYAVPRGSGWRVEVEDAAGQRRTILDSPSPVHVFGWP